MKKSILLTLLLFYGVVVSAQNMIARGSLIGNGSVSFSAGSSKSVYTGISYKDTFTDASLAPSAAYFIINDLGVGLNLDLSTSKSKDGASSITTTSNSVTIGPVIRYYITKGPFVQGYFGVGSSKTTYSNSDTYNSKYSVTQGYLGAGYSVRISDTILLDPMVGYQSMNSKDKIQSGHKQVDNYFFLQVGFTLILIKK